jgi:hypothetical protein
MNSPSKAVKKLSSHDYDGLVIGLLDDIVSAENRAQRLIERIDSISKRPTLRMVDVDSYLWTTAAIAVAAFALGTMTGFIIFMLAKR